MQVWFSASLVTRVYTAVREKKSRNLWEFHGFQTLSTCQPISLWIPTRPILASSSHRTVSRCSVASDTSRSPTILNVLIGWCVCWPTRASAQGDITGR